MRKNKHRDMTPFDMSRKPRRQNLFLLPFIWILCKVRTWGRGLQIRRKGMDGLKPPFVVLSEHQGFTDYYITQLSLFPHRVSYVSDMEGFAAFSKTIYGMIGCIPTRRFVRSSHLVRSIRHVVQHNRDIIVIYPEARHSNVGTASVLPPSTGKLVQLLGLPVVVLKIHGSYLTTPIWDESHRRKSPLRSSLELVLTPEQVREWPVEEINALLEEKFQYDEYRWQREKRIRISHPGRAEGLHRVLYQCAHCHSEYTMRSRGDSLRCESCGKEWRMDEYGQLAALDGAGETEFAHIPDWYEFQRRQVHQEINDGRYTLDLAVRIEALPNAKGFVPQGKGRLVQNPEGFWLHFDQTGEELRFSAKSMVSVHTEYNYRGKGDCLVLSTRDCCYYLYPESDRFNVTKVQFAAEYFHQRLQTEKSPLRDPVAIRS